MKKKFLLFTVLFSLFTCQILAQAKEITEDDLYEEILPNMTKPIVIDFWASWCKPCQMYHSTYMSAARRYSHKADFYRIDIDENRELCEDIGINCVPTTIVIYSTDGDILRSEGVLESYELSKLISEGVRRFRK